MILVLKQFEAVSLLDLHCGPGTGRGKPVLMHRDPPASHQSGARSGLAGTELGRGRGPSAFKSALADELLITERET